jgi:hypothetical protein
MDWTISETERSRLDRLEQTIRAGLLEIRDRELFRAGSSSWEEYCLVKWGFGATDARRLVNAAKVVKDLVAGSSVQANALGQPAAAAAARVNLLVDKSERAAHGVNGDRGERRRRRATGQEEIDLAGKLLVRLKRILVCLGDGATEALEHVCLASAALARLPKAKDRESGRRGPAG